MNQNLTVKLDESYNKGGLKKYNVRNHPDKLTAIFVDKNELIVKLEYIDNGIKEFIYENNLVVEEKEIDVDLGEYSIKYKYDVVPEINFKYENRNLVRNPYGKKGKK